MPLTWSTLLKKLPVGYPDTAMLLSSSAPPSSSPSATSGAPQTATTSALQTAVQAKTAIG